MPPLSCRLSVMACAVLAVLAATASAAAPPPLGTYEQPNPATPANVIDQAVLPRLRELSIKPANPCSDAVFIRRVYVDVIGGIPTGQEVKEFLSDPSPQKRVKLIDRLLEREEFADYWAMKWADTLRIKAEFPINLWPNAAQAYHHWIRTCISQNKPYDWLVRQMLTSSGSNFRVPPVNFYRAAQTRDASGLASAVALGFMATRTDKWPKERLEGMAAFFARVSYKSSLEWKEEIVLLDLTKPGPETGTFPDGQTVKFPADQDPREIFADWLISPKNPWFTRAVANRMWWWLLGRGIVHEPDDIRDDNLPSNPALLAVLEKSLVESRYDLKQLMRLILNSQTYQLSSVPRSTDPAAAANFASYPLRRLEAEVLIDALCQITGTTEKYSSIIPEPFTFIPEAQRTISLADGSITSPFLELFGRPARDTGQEMERNNRLSPAQRLHLLNSTHVQKKLEQGRALQGLIQSKGTTRETTTELYLSILARYPTEDELKVAEAYVQSPNVKGREGLLDLAWALINGAEFLCRH